MSHKELIDGMNHITISVKNIDRAFSFYKDVLGLKPVMKSSRNAYFCAGKAWIALNQDEAYEPSNNYAHIAFNIPEKNYHEFVKLLEEKGIKEWQQNESEGDSLYLLDDSGNKLEIHISTLEDRVRYGKAHYGEDVQWF